MIPNVELTGAEQGTHIRFVLRPRYAGRMTDVWDVVNKYENVQIGFVSWYAGWRRYCFFPLDNTVFEQVCLREIADFCERKTREHKVKGKVTHGTLLDMA